MAESQEKTKRVRFQDTVESLGNDEPINVDSPEFLPSQSKALSDKLLEHEQKRLRGLLLVFLQVVACFDIVYCFFMMSYDKLIDGTQGEKAILLISLLLRVMMLVLIAMSCYKKFDGDLIKIILHLFVPLH